MRQLELVARTKELLLLEEFESLLLQGTLLEL